MSLKSLPEFSQIHISQLEIGATLINLGPILEIEEHSNHYCLTIARMSEKQVIKFDKDIVLVTQ